MARTKPDKIREETYDFLVEALYEYGKEKEIVGRSKEGIVMTNHLDGEHVIIKVIKKKKEIPSDEITAITTYEEKIKEYERSKLEDKGD